MSNNFTNLFTEKKIHVLSGSAQFKLELFKGQMYLFVIKEKRVSL